MEQLLENKLLSGYWYRCGYTEPSGGHRGGGVNTGMAGAKMFIETMRKDGWQNEIIASAIEVYVDGEYVKMNDPRLKHLNLKCLKHDEVIETGWSVTKDYTESDGTVVYQIEGDNDVFWEMEYNPETYECKIEKYTPGDKPNTHNSTTVMDCKIENKKDLLQQMDWLGIK